MGQHFLEDGTVIETIIAGGALTRDDIVVEIGSGLGALTMPVLSRVCHVVAIEKDPLLMSLLRENIPPNDRGRITFVSGDVLKLDLKEIAQKFPQKIKVLGNLPYNISSPFLEKLVGNRRHFTMAILMFQYEFARRLVAEPGKKEYGSLSVIMQYYATITPLIEVSREAFYPKPKVNSMVLLIDFEKPHSFRAENEEFFQGVVKAAFGFRRKTLLNSLERGMRGLPKEMLEKVLKECDIDPRRRAETLTIDEYLRLSSAFTEDKTIS
jgi:16S rRNA (adenine1518-N6/adenine1519-N6)-dimethyltransferase